jgi:hypothetical protein
MPSESARRRFLERPGKTLESCLGKNEDFAFRTSRLGADDDKEFCEDEDGK